MTPEEEKKARFEALMDAKKAWHRNKATWT